MPQTLTTVFVWNETREEKTMVAASASWDSIEVYYALENRCARAGVSCSVSSHTWFDDNRRYVVEEVAAAD